MWARSPVLALSGRRVLGVGDVAERVVGVGLVPVLGAYSGDPSGGGEGVVPSSAQVIGDGLGHAVGTVGVAAFLQAGVGVRV